MRPRTLVLMALALLAALAAWRRRPPAEQRGPHPGAQVDAVQAGAEALADSAAKARAAALVIVLLAGLLALAALGTWRLALAGKGDDISEVLALTSLSTPTDAAPLPTARPTSLPEWRLLAGGDVLMDLSEAAGIDPFAGIVPALATAELVAVNVEMAIATGGTPAVKSFVFLAPPSAARTMAAAGVDVGNLGNNHALDFGKGALLDTITNLRAAGVAPVGGGANEGEAYAPASFEIVGVRVAVIGVSRVLPQVSWVAGEGAGVASAFAEERLLEEVRSAEASHDVVVVMIHWGFEGAPCPNSSQVRLGDALLEAGAAVVLGTHPHVLQPIVLGDGGLIAYSLGNFVWAPRSGPEGETGVLEVQFEGSRLSGYRFHPHVLDPQGAPVPAGPEAAARIETSVNRAC